jgi:hypothetical protein
MPNIEHDPSFASQILHFIHNNMHSIGMARHEN